ncbi:hypothetical protein CAEBREN_13949 [Caenorhabditis brenneri]|uniref:F-box domain-containing protein n=1 Tax=Caenorhabditis brenneri TaxID=135651 RepID=G0NYA6_CAEBE|nr:hypothetical protein CAEBREN_13949 [Caenorhabditis brenneri]
MAIPLFRLPILVIQLILESMGFIDIFVLTSVSSKTKRIFKNLVKVKNHEMHIVMGKKENFFTFQRRLNPDFFEQFYSESRKRHPKEVFFMKIDTIDQVPSEFSPAEDGAAALTTYWSKNCNHGAMLYNALIELFELPVKRIKMDLTDVAVKTHRGWINWFNETLSDAFILEIMGECNFSDFVWMLENVKTENTLVFQIEATDYSDTFESSNINFTFKAKTVAIVDGRWIKMDHLKSIEARSVSLFKITLTDFQINLFLRDWKDLKEAFNMKQLIIFFEREADPGIVLAGMNATNEEMMKPDHVRNQWSFKMANGEKCTVTYAKLNVDVPTFGFEFKVGN